MYIQYTAHIFSKYSITVQTFRLRDLQCRPRSGDSIRLRYRSHLHYPYRKAYCCASYECWPFYAIRKTKKKYGKQQQQQQHKNEPSAMLGRFQDYVAIVTQLLDAAVLHKKAAASFMTDFLVRVSTDRNCRLK
jgi:hypothetical protein